MNEYNELLDFRRRVSDNYSMVRNSTTSSEETLAEFRKQRNFLFATHSQSALDTSQQAVFKGLLYFDYNPAWRFVLPMDLNINPREVEVPLQEDGVFRMQSFAKVEFVAQGQTLNLTLYWVLGYGGGVFLPFRDQTSKSGETYGGGRYLLDTIKNADLGQDGNKIVLDFNYAYNASCAYHPRWHCPLAPQENWLGVPVLAGEKAYPDYPVLGQGSEKINR